MLSITMTNVRGCADCEAPVVNTCIKIQPVLKEALIYQVHAFQSDYASNAELHMAISAYCWRLYK